MTVADRDAPTETGKRPSASSPRRSALVFPVGVLLLVVVLGMFRLSGSSLGLYHDWHGDGDAGVLAGRARHIRSDEWVVRTPWVLRQAELGLPKQATGGMGMHDVVVLADLPTRSWELVLRPHLFSYLVFDSERAFAVEWWLLAAVQLLGVYALLYALTKRPAISALAASLLALSPASQWWWVPGAFVIVGYGCMATALLLFAHRAPDHRRRMAWSVGAGWAMAAFLTTLYVPWQVGTAIVVVFVGLAALLPDLIRRETRRRTLSSLLIVGGVSVGVACLLFGSFVLAHRDTIRTIAGTEYPGGRQARGGGANLVVLWGSTFDYFSATSRTGTANGTNQSENASALLFLLPVGVACFALSAAGRLGGHPTVPPLLACLAGGTVLLTWMLLPVPPSLGRFLFLNRVPPERLLLPLGLASVLALGLLVSYQLGSGHRVGSGALAVSVGTFAAAQWWGAGAYRADDSPIDLSLASVLVLVVVAGTALALGRWPLGGLVVLAAFTFWQASLVNPVQRGTDPLTANPLRKAVDQVAISAPAEAGWVAFNADPFVKGTLTAAGVNHLTGVSPYPDQRAWRILDPELRHRDVWNRYAHIGFDLGAPGSETTFKLNSSDNFTVTVDPCSPALTRLGVEFFVLQNAEMLACSSIIRKVRVGSGYATFYRRVPAS
jgi:hypothetical protein